MAKKKTSPVVIVAVTAVAAVGGVWLYNKYLKGLFQSAWTTSGYAGALGSTCNGCVQGLPPSKVRAQQWLESKMEYRGENPVEHEVIDDVTGMDYRRAGELAKVLLRSYGQAPTHEHVPWNGIGRPV
jgi:hypothetical protein